MAANNGSEHDVPDQIVRLRRMARHAWEHFKQDRCLEEAASLAYASLLSLVPLLAVIFGIIAAFPIFSEWSHDMQLYLFNNLLPSAGQQMEHYLTSFLDSVSELTLPGTITLIVTALLLMIRVEVAFNRVWRVGKPRSLTSRIVVYWSVLTLAPILIGAAIAMSVQALFGDMQLENALPPALFRLGTFFVSWTVFTLLFMLVPNRRVRFRDAALGAFLSALLFEVAKFGFVAYISNANYTVIYGALATIPIFLFWLYLVWVVVLLGASFTASLTTFQDRPLAEGDWPDGAELQMAFRLVGHLWTAQREGQKCAREKLLELEPRAGERKLQRILECLESARIVVSDDDDSWMLARDIADLTLSALYHSGRFHLPWSGHDDIPVDTAWDRVFASVVERVRDDGLECLERPLRDLYLEPEKS